MMSAALGNLGGRGDAAAGKEGQDRLTELLL